MWLSKFNFKTRLIFGFGVLIIINLILVITSIKDLEQSNKNLTKLYQHPFTVSSALRSIDNERSTISWALDEIYLPENKLKIVPLLNTIKQSDAKIKIQLKIILKLYLGNKNDVIKAKNIYFNWERVRNNEFNLLLAGKKEEAYKIHNTKQYSKLESELFKQTQIIINFANHKSTELYNINSKETKKAKVRLVILLIFSFLLSFVITTIISRSITIPLSKLSQQIQKNFDLYPLENVKINSEQDLLEYSVIGLEKISEAVLGFNERLEKEVAIESKELFEKNQFFEKMMAKTPLAFIYFDTNLKVQIWNPAAETIFGYTAKEAIGKNVVDLIVNQDIKAEIHEVIKSVFDDSAKQNQQNENITKSGKRIICNWYNTAIKDENDKVIGLSSLVEDVTKHIKIATELEETNQSLQDMVYVASHDLQVPLVSMEGFASEVLDSQKDKLDEDGVYCLTRLQSNVQRMHKLVLSLLDISRLSTHINQYEKFNLNKVLDNIIKDLSLTIEENKASINYKKLPTIYADKQRIESVLRNLITNALNYDGKNVAITFKEGVLAIADDGIGIPQDQLKKIFYSGERLKMNNAEGVGMGLAFCEKVIKKFNKITLIV